jgi:hypothetical protein
LRFNIQGGVTRFTRTRWPCDNGAALRRCVAVYGRPSFAREVREHFASTALTFPVRLPGALAGFYRHSKPSARTPH